MVAKTLSANMSYGFNVTAREHRIQWMEAQANTPDAKRDDSCDIDSLVAAAIESGQAITPAEIETQLKFYQLLIQARKPKQSESVEEKCDAVSDDDDETEATEVVLDPEIVLDSVSRKRMITKTTTTTTTTKIIIIIMMMIIVIIIINIIKKKIKKK